MKGAGEKRGGEARARIRQVRGEEERCVKNSKKGIRERERDKLSTIFRVRTGIRKHFVTLQSLEVSMMH